MKGNMSDTKNKVRVISLNSTISILNTLYCEPKVKMKLYSILGLIKKGLAAEITPFVLEVVRVSITISFYSSQSKSYNAIQVTDQMLN